MQHVLNKDVHIYGQNYHPHKFQASVFQAIPWEQYGGAQHGYDYGAEVARFDISNDGTEELVVRFSTMIFNKIIHRLFILDGHESIESLKTIKDIEEKSIGMISIERYDFKYIPAMPHAGWMERGKFYYKGLSEYVAIYPFIFDHKSYVLIKNAPDTGPDPSELLIAQYKKGIVHTANKEQIQDVCYMK